jgi:hypothetical protein
VADKKGKSLGCGFHTVAGMERAFSVSNIDLLRASAILNPLVLSTRKYLGGFYVSPGPTFKRVALQP